MRMRRLFIKAPHLESLKAFAGRLAVMSQSNPWEERDSVNCPAGHYFRQSFGPVEIVAQIADDPACPTANFLIWVRG